MEKQKVYIIEMSEGCEYRAFSSEAKAKEFMLKKYLKDYIDETKYCTMQSDNVDEVVKIIKIDIESILKDGYLDDAMYMNVAELDADEDEEESNEGV